MKRRLWLIPAALLAVFLDAFVLPFLSQNGIRPLFTLSLALAATAVTKVQDGIPIALFGGLLCDLFCNPYIGLSAAAYLVAVAIMYGFVRKAEKGRALVILFAAVASLAAEALIFIFSLAIGARFDAARLLRATLPSLVLESLLVFPLCAAFRSREKGNSFFR
jgi:rod shape-determining protein MreD